MATTEDLKRRMRAFAEQLQSELEEIPNPEGKSWLDLMEDIALEIGDVFTTTAVEKCAETRAKECDPHCPVCGKAGQCRGARERELITRRGPAKITEPEFYCVGCRKSFFPDDARCGQ